MATATAAPVHTTVVGVFDDRSRANAAVEELRLHGFLYEQIGLVSPGVRDDPAEGRPLNYMPEGEAVGAATGATIGGAAGILSVAIMMPPIGPAIIGGALLTWLAGVGSGAAAGTVLGGLFGLGIPEDASRWYENELKAGRSLVTVEEADDRAEEVRDVMRHHHATVREPSTVGTYGTGVPATPF